MICAVYLHLNNRKEGVIVLKIAICEDESHHLAVLERMIGKWADRGTDEVSIQSYQDVDSMRQDFDMGDRFDICFFDVEVKDKNGLDLAHYIRKADKRVLYVFVTNHQEYAMQAFSADTFRFMTKPIAESECAEVLCAAKEKLNYRDQDVFIVHAEDMTFRVPKADILYFECQRHYLTMVTICDTFRFRGSLKSLATDFKQPRFFSCHRSFIVNLEHVYCIHPSEVTLTNKHSIPISRRKWHDLNECFLAVYIRSKGIL